MHQLFSSNDGKPKSIKLFYCNQFNSNHKTDEIKLKNIIKRNVKPIDPETIVNLFIYYRNTKLGSLLISNKLFKRDVRSGVVYQYSCPVGSCNAASYIGYTTCTLAQRFYTHVQTGSIRLHNKNVHNSKPLTKELHINTTVLYNGSSKSDLTIAEALLIKQHNPILNVQDDSFTRTLKIF